MLTMQPWSGEKHGRIGQSAGMDWNGLGKYPVQTKKSVRVAVTAGPSWLRSVRGGVLAGPSTTLTTSLGNGHK